MAIIGAIRDNILLDRSNRMGTQSRVWDQGDVTQRWMTPSRVKIDLANARALVEQNDYTKPTTMWINSRCDEDITSMDTTSPIRWSWSSTYFRTAGKHLLATVVTASYGFQFGSSTTPWKDHQVYFETDPASCRYLIRVGHNHWFYTEMYSVNGESVPICFYRWFWE
jgi:D-alanyl-D-alanine carboxypeptidase